MLKVIYEYNGNKWSFRSFILINEKKIIKLNEFKNGKKKVIYSANDKFKWIQKKKRK